MTSELITRLTRLFKPTDNSTTDTNGLPQNWDYDTIDPEHIFVVTQFREYLTGHDLTHRAVRNVRVQDGYVRYNAQNTGQDSESDSEQQYLVDPDFVEQFDESNQSESGFENPHHGISFENAKQLDPDYQPPAETEKQEEEQKQIKQ